MNEISVQQALIKYVRLHSPHTYAEEAEKLRVYYGRLLAAARGARERRNIARDYRQASIAMVILLAREISAITK